MQRKVGSRALRIPAQIQLGNERLRSIEAELLYNSADGCGICGIRLQGSRKHIDHGHNTSKIRGVLCSKCNHAIGLMHEDKEILAKAIDYLLGRNIRSDESRK